MFFRKITTRKNGKEYVYVKLIENYRINGKMKQRVVANFGSIENLSTDRINDLIVSLKKLYQEVEAQDEKKLDLDPIKLKIPGVLDLFQHNQSVQSMGENLSEEERKTFIAILIKMMVLPERKEPIHDICQQLGLVEAASVKFYNLIKRLGEFDIRASLLKSSLACNPGAETIYIHIINTIFQGLTFETDIAGCVSSSADYQKRIFLLLACDKNSNPLGFSVVEHKSELQEKVNTMIAQLINHTQGDVIILDSAKDLDPERMTFPVAQPANQQQEGKLNANKCYFHSIRLEQKSEDRVKEIRANLAKVVAGLENIKADILLGKLNKESAIRKKAETVIKANNCRDLVTYHINEPDLSLVYHIKEEAMREKTYSLVTTTWCVPSNKVKKKLPESINIKTDQFQLLTDQLNIPLINMYADYHYSSDIISGHVSLEIIIKQVAVVAKLPQQGGDTHITY